MNKNVKDDAERTTAQDAVRHLVSEEGVPKRNITFGDFLEDEASNFKEKLIRSIRYHYPPSNLLDELVYLRWRYFISDEDFISDYRIFCYLFDGETLSIFFEDWSEDQDEDFIEDVIEHHNLILASFGSKRGIRRAMEKFDVWTTDRLEDLSLCNKVATEIERPSVNSTSSVLGRLWKKWPSGWF